MAVVVARLEGEDIPHEHRGAGIDQVFKVTAQNGDLHFCRDDVDAAKLAVELSARDQAPSDEQ